MKNANFPSALNLNPNLIGWFAIGFSQELKLNQTKEGALSCEKYSLSRAQDGILLFNGNKNNIIEQNNIIYTWRHPNEKNPLWYIPKLDENGWTPFLYHQLQARSHPQEVYENSVDLAHFSIKEFFLEF